MADVLDNPANRLLLPGLEMTAKALEVELRPFEARGPEDFERAFAAMAIEQIGAAVIGISGAYCFRASVLAGRSAPSL